MTRNAKDRKGWILIASVVTVLVSLAALGGMKDQSAKRGDDNCRIDKSADNSTVLLFDKSDAISDQAFREMRRRAAHFIRDSTATDEQISIYAITNSTRDTLRELLSLCRPPSSGNRIFENTALIEKRFSNQFVQVVDSVLANLPQQSENSEIAGAISDLSDMAVLRAQNSRLHVFSDLMEHSSTFSLYNCDDTTNVVQRYKRTRAGGRDRPAFRNVKVTLHIIPRLGMPDRNIACRDKLWLWYFGDNAGASASLNVNMLPTGSVISRKRSQ